MEPIANQSSLMKYLRYWKSFLVVLIPLCLLPLPIASGTLAASCAYVVLLMGLFWVLDLLPLPVTSIIPVALFPLLGIMSTSEVSMYYMKSTCMLFFGGLTLAIAVEHCQLHKRIALRALSLVGTSPGQLMVGFMVPTAFLSMWISNTATAAMMVPILNAVLTELEVEEEEEAEEENQKHSGRVNKRDFEKENMNQRRMMIMSICFSANIGGTGTIIGTPPNLIMLDAINMFDGQPVTFGTWMGFAIPQAIICLVFTWMWLYVYYEGIPCFRRSSETRLALELRRDAAYKVIQSRYDELGAMSYHEKSVLSCFVFTVALWFFRSPGFMPGWGDRLEDLFGIEIGDATPAILCALLLFTLPRNPNFFKELTGKGTFTSPSEPLVTWKVVESNMPWGVILLIGGGFAMAQGTISSGLSEWIGNLLVNLRDVPDFWLLVIVCIMSSVLTQIASNAATASIMMPVLIRLSLELSINPLYLTLPSVLVCSFAFMLPVSTGPNAICFGPSGMKTWDMMKLGFVVNVICMIVCLACISTLGQALFSVDEFPEWAVQNRTRRFLWYAS